MRENETCMHNCNTNCDRGALNKRNSCKGVSFFEIFILIIHKHTCVRYIIKVLN